MSQSHRHTPGVSEPWGPHSPAAHLGALPHLVRECLPMRTSRSSTVKFLSQGGYRRQWAAVRTQRSLMRLAPQSSSWGLFRKSITCLRREAGSRGSLCQANSTSPWHHVNTSSMGISYRKTHLKASNERNGSQKARAPQESRYDNMGRERALQGGSNSSLTCEFFAICLPPRLSNRSPGNINT